MQYHFFSPTYIRMAEASAEIQAARPDLQEQDAWDPPHPAMGSIFAKPYKDGWEFRAFAWFDEAERWAIANNWHENDDSFIWLPLLHQLLGMLGRPKEFIMYDEQRQYRDWFDSYGNLAQDWHELALAVVMREKFRKRWDGKEWVKATS